MRIFLCGWFPGRFKTEYTPIKEIRVGGKKKTKLRRRGGEKKK